MGIAESLKEIYFSMEDRYYALFDKIEEHVPIYAVIEPIDKIVPSFLIFCIAAMLLIAGAGMFLYNSLAAGTAQFSATITDESGAGITGAQLTLKYAGQEKSFVTDAFGKTEKIELPRTDLKIEASAENYKDYNEALKLEKDALGYEIKLTAKEGAGIKRIIRLVNKAGQPIYGELFYLSFKCINRSAKAPEDTTTTSGEATITEPLNCSGLVVGVKSSNYESIDSFSILQDTQSIYLTDKITGKGSLKVNVEFNSKPVEDGIIVYLYTSEGAGALDQKATQNGFARFDDIPAAGEYTVKTKATQKYGQATKENVKVQNGDEKNVTLSLEQNVVGIIKIKVVDRDNEQAIGNVHVTLKLGNTVEGEQTTSTDNNGIVEFAVSEDTQYVATADNDNYCFGTLSGLTIAQGLSVIRLRKFTGECGGALKVKVIDQDANPVRNAVVSLGNEQHFFTGFSNKATDINGIVTFNGVPSGTFAAFAFKATNSGWSDAKYFNRRGSATGEPDLIVTMQIPDGIVKVKAVDKENKPVAFASVYFIDNFNGQTIGGGAMPADTNGIAALTTRADKEVFAIIESSGLASYKSTAVRVLGNSEILILAKMLPKIDKFEVELLGLYNSGLAATTLATGAEYVARFRIKVPDEIKDEATELGLHVRVGTEKITEKDLLFIKALNAPKASIMKGTSYAENYAEDIASISSSDAKWANIVWTDAEANVIEAEATIKVKETAAFGKRLDVYYRAWESNGALKRDPPSEYVAEDELYANTKVSTYQVGTGTLCSDKFCFDATITDKEQALTTPVLESYQATAFGKYSIAFTISNASKFDTDTIRNAELRIKNAEKNLLFRNYSIIDAANKPIEGAVEGYEFERIDAGNLSPTRKIAGTIDFVPQNAISGVIRFEIIDKDLGIIVFAKDITISVTAENNLAVTIEPTLLPSGIENEITVNVKGAEGGLEIDKAVVRVLDRFGTQIARKETNKRGNAILVIPGQSPGEKLKLLVEVPNYNLFEKEITVEPKILGITPSSIGLALNPKSAFTAEKQLKAKNLVAFPLTISRMEFSGRTRGLIDAEAINNSLKSFEGLEIKPGTDVELLFKAILSDAGKNIAERAELNGVLTMEVSSFGQSWLFEVPVKITIGLGGEATDPNCLSVTKKEWKAATEGKPLTLELQIENNCVVGEEPVALQGLEAKVDWQGNKIGEFDLMTENSATTLRAGYFKTILNRIEKEQIINVQLTFTPSGGANGMAKAKIVIQAANPTESKEQTLSTEIAAEISVINLVDCVSFSKDDLEIVLPNTPATGVPVLPGSASETFAVKTTKCGAPVQVKLESELDLSSKDFTLKEDDSKDIKVSAAGMLPGKYGIKVRVEGASAHTAKQIQNIEVLVNPSADSCIRLSRYEFNIYDDPNDPYDGADSVRVFNECPDKAVDVTVDMHSWADAMKDGLKWAAIGFALGVLGKMNEGATLGEAIWGKGATSKTGTVAAGSGTIAAGTNAGTASGRATAGGQTGRSTTTNTYAIVDGKMQYITLTIDSSNENIAYDESGQQYTKSYDGVWIKPRQTPTGQATMAQGNSLGTGIGGVFGSIGSIFTGLTGTTNPWINALLMFGTGTLANYYSQGEKELTFTATDVELGSSIGLFKNNAGTEKDSDILAKVNSKETIEPKKGKEFLSVKTKEVVFTNKTGIVQSDALNPLYRFLKVDGQRHVYSANQDYKKDAPDPNALRQDAPQNILQLFHLQFNSFKACTDGNCITVPQELRNCQIGSKLGSTGEKALPRIKLSWDWKNIAMNECDEDNTNYVYCDATQFSIELLKKIHLIQEFVESNAPFDCPSLVSGIEPVTQSLSSTALDIGITKLEILKAQKDINVVATAESNNQKNMAAEITITLTNNETNAVQNCVRTTGLLTKSVIGCDFRNLATGNYTAKAILTKTTGCNACENNSVLNDKATKQFNIGYDNVLVKCEPYSTIEGTQNRLEKFIIASEQASDTTNKTLVYPAGISNAEQMSKLVKFKAHLIKDGYSIDFRKDFHDFAMTRDFFGTEQYYKDATNGLGKYFSNEKAMEFDYFGAPIGPIRDPGIYDVSIDINFQNANMQFFKDGEPIAKITITMEKTKDAKPASPFYYLPFNGNIGEETGRVGYGLNYLLKSPDKTVKINNDIMQPVRVHDLPGSNPAFTLNGAFGDDFRTLNQTSRGIVLDVDLTRDLLTISPSKATPVIMKVESQKSEDAYGYYALEIDNEPQATSSFLTKWIGVGLQCSDFAGNNMENYKETPDLHGLDSKCTLLGQNDLTSYGLEWCNKKFSGKVFLQGLFFTPQGKVSRLYKVTSAEKMDLISLDSEGEAIALNGIKSIADIGSVEDVFDLVKDEKVCVLGYDNQAQTEFFWNPKFALDQLKAQRQKAEKDCIKAS